MKPIEAFLQQRPLTLTTQSQRLRVFQVSVQPLQVYSALCSCGKATTSSLQQARVCPSCGNTRLQYKDESRCLYLVKSLDQSRTVVSFRSLRAPVVGQTIQAFVQENELILPNQMSSVVSSSSLNQLQARDQLKKIVIAASQVVISIFPCLDQSKISQFVGVVLLFYVSICGNSVLVLNSSDKNMLNHCQVLIRNLLYSLGKSICIVSDDFHQDIVIQQSSVRLKQEIPPLTVAFMLRNITATTADISQYHSQRLVQISNQTVVIQQNFPIIAITQTGVQLQFNNFIAMQLKSHCITIFNNPTCQNYDKSLLFLNNSYTSCQHVQNDSQIMNQLLENFTQKLILQKCTQKFNSDQSKIDFLVGVQKLIGFQILSYELCSLAISILLVSDLENFDLVSLDSIIIDNQD